MIKLIIGLGNHDREYTATRHNAGMLALAHFHRLHDGSPWTRRGNAQHADILRSGLPRLILCHGLGYMNNTGKDVRPVFDFYKCSPQEVLVLYDDLELPFGRIKLKSGGGHGGHNGLRSLDQHLGSKDYLRIRIGIGRPERGTPADWVLSRFSRDQEAVLPLVWDAVDKLVMEVSALDGKGLQSLVDSGKECIAFQGA